MTLAHIRSDSTPTSRPSATGVDHEVAPPVAGLAALGAAGVALSAAAAWVAATGSEPEACGSSAAVHAFVFTAPIGAGLYAACPLPTTLVTQARSEPGREKEPRCREALQNAAKHGEGARSG